MSHAVQLRRHVGAQIAGLPEVAAGEVQPQHRMLNRPVMAVVDVAARRISVSRNRLMPNRRGRRLRRRGRPAPRAGPATGRPCRVRAGPMTAPRTPTARGP